MPSSVIINRRSCSSDHPSKRKREITDDDITDYLVNKALRIANKLSGADSNPFVWRKKIQRHVLHGVPVPQLLSLKAAKKRSKERELEIAKIKRRKEERAVEKAQREEEMALLARERARAEFRDWEKKEEEFDCNQAKIRSEIRLRENRAKPIDILGKHCDASSDLVFKGSSVEEMEEVRGEIKMRLHLERETPTRSRYWEAVLVVCEWELALASGSGRMGGGVHMSIEADVESVLQGKSYDEIEVLQSQIESQMQSGTAKVVEYWESLLHRLRFYKAKAYLEENCISQSQSENIKTEEVVEEVEEEVGGSYSPQLIHGGDDDDDDVIEPEMDKAVLERKRIAVEDAMRVTELGSDQCRLRKPKYHTRVHTGYEWNKYNQTHYDHDNPPPKTVIGYKFDVFYPDLVDKSRAPRYSIEEDGDETCIIRFHGGAPYEDIAFRVVNKEWEYSHKKGFKCSFERGVLHVYFNFKRFRYRR